MYAKQIKNIQLKIYQTKYRSVFRNSNDNLISIANLFKKKHAAKAIANIVLKVTSRSIFYENYGSPSWTEK
jgi:hypothetical protein